MFSVTLAKTLLYMMKLVYIIPIVLLKILTVLWFELSMCVCVCVDIYYFFY